MPDIEKLMQEWPPEVEEMLKTANLPTADLDCDLTEYIDIICCKSINSYVLERLSYTRFFYEDINSLKT